ncbi:hypothetical protein [Terasakiella sp. SH-1]|uniref:hypothetical protein n=1 Tax=Terasakiella sp. SH-1 TaxID=2560057 RepID=UPI0010731E59|nr:hypothetical protein [Terasakiella sp. SH-1]
MQGQLIDLQVTSEKLAGAIQRAPNIDALYDQLEDISNEIEDARKEETRLKALLASVSSTEEQVIVREEGQMVNAQELVATYIQATDALFGDEARQVIRKRVLALISDITIWADGRCKVTSGDSWFEFRFTKESFHGRTAKAVYLYDNGENKVRLQRTGPLQLSMKRW